MVRAFFCYYVPMENVIAMESLEGEMAEIWIEINFAHQGIPYFIKTPVRKQELADCYTIANSVLFGKDRMNLDRMQTDVGECFTYLKPHTPPDAR